jgi:hypothetical protein
VSKAPSGAAQTPSIFLMSMRISAKALVPRALPTETRVTSTLAASPTQRQQTTFANQLEPGLVARNPCQQQPVSLSGLLGEAPDPRERLNRGMQPSAKTPPRTQCSRNEPGPPLLRVPARSAHPPL